MKNRVLIVEDDPMAQQLFRLIVEGSDCFELVEAIASADYADIFCDRGGIDLVVLDIQTAMHANGLDAAERIRKKHPQIKLIVVTSMVEKAALDRAKTIGVDSFWYKEVRKDAFEQLLERTMNGEHLFPEESPVLIFGNARSTEISDRELEVLKLVVTGASNTMIAKELEITERTVKAHVQSLMWKTGYENRTQLAVKAQECGIVTLD